MALFSGPWGTLEARPEGAAITRRGGGQSGSTEPVDADIAILLEQGLAEETGAGVLVPWDAWASAVELGVRVLTAHSVLSHLLLEVDRTSELGRADFRYIMRWREGAQEVAIARVGAYLLHEASGRWMHLDRRTFALAEAMSRFNALAPVDRSAPGAAWGTLAAIHRDAAESGARLDGYLRENTVIVPSTLELTIREEPDGSVTFLPRVPELGEPGLLAAKFEQSLKIGDTMVLTTPDGRRMRILWSATQQEVLHRMQRVRRVRGDNARRLKEEPVSVFDGVADAIDLHHVALEYGPRVVGVGPLARQTDSKAQSPNILDHLRVAALNPELERAAAEAPPAPPTITRQAVALELLDAATGSKLEVRLRTGEEVAALRDVVQRAVAQGATQASYQGHAIVVEPALLSVLDRYIHRHGDGRPGSGEVGRSGHLYLLINEHQDSLTEALRVTVESPADIQPVEVAPPNSLAPGVVLQTHQRQGLSWLETCRTLPLRRGALLADDMGLGKTLQLLSHIAGLVESGALLDEPHGGPNGPWRPVLIIAPLVLIDAETWLMEMRSRFADEGRVFEPYLVLRDDGIKRVMASGGPRDLLGKPLLDADRLMAHKVVLTTYETLVAYQHSLAQRVGGRPLWSLVIFDEAQEIKVPSTKQSYAAKALDARFKIAATGTPVETRLRDLWNLLDTVEPTVLGTQRDFIENFESPVMDGNTQSRTAALEQLRTHLRYQRADALLLRRDKSILEGLPPRQEHRLPCPLSEKEREAIQGVIQSSRRRSAKNGSLATLQRLHLVSQHPWLVSGSDVLPSVDDLLRDSSRMQGLVNLLERIKQQGEKALVFARSVPTQRLLAHVLSQHFSVPVDVINGQTGMDVGNRRRAGEVRRRMLNQFQQREGFAVIVLSPFVAGVGLTLVEANHVFHYGRWWNPAVENQATDRVYRIGQQRPVHVYYLIGVDPTGSIPQTFDEVLDKLLQSRRALATDFLIPVGEEDTATLIMRQLTDENAEAPEQSRIDLAETSEQVAAQLATIVEAEGGQLAWLGPDGRWGVHVLWVTSSGALHGARIVTTEAPNDASQAVIGGMSWTGTLDGRAVEMRVLAKEVQPAGEGGGSRSWRDVADVAGAPGARWSVLPVCDTTTTVKQALGIAH